MLLQNLLRRFRRRLRDYPFRTHPPHAYSSKEGSVLWWSALHALPSFGGVAAGRGGLFLGRAYLRAIRFQAEPRKHGAAFAKKLRRAKGSTTVRGHVKEKWFPV